ncbi:MAG: hypothetical protein R3F65_32585 [bacterium]
MKAHYTWLALALVVGAIPAAAQTPTDEATLEATLDHLDALRTAHAPALEPRPIEAARAALAKLSAADATVETKQAASKAIEASIDALITHLGALTPPAPRPIEPQTTCGREAVVCLAATRPNDGDARYTVDLFAGDTLAKSLQPGATLEVRLLVALDDPGAYAVDAPSAAHTQHVLKPSPANALAPATDAPAPIRASALQKLTGALQRAIAAFERNTLTVHPASTTFSVPDDPRIGRLGLRVTRDGVRLFAESIEVDHGEYFFDIGVLVPIAWDASRTLVRRRIEVDGAPRDTLELVTDHDITPAIVITAYPAGRPVGRVSTVGDGAGVARAFGLQAGLDLLLDEPLDRIYLGAVFEPVAGFGLSLGCAFIRRDGRPAGLDADATVDPADAVTPSRTYAPSFYFGVSLSTELVTIGRKVASSL